jgi:hypothetical protein
MSLSDGEPCELFYYLIDFLFVEATRVEVKAIDVNIEVQPLHKLFLNKMLLDFGFFVDVGSGSLKAQMTL